MHGMEPFDDQTKLVRALLAATEDLRQGAWGGFLALVKSVTQADGVALVLDQGSRTEAWQEGPCPDLGAEMRQNLRFDRVYAQDSLPRGGVVDGHFRAVKVRGESGRQISLNLSRGSHQRDFRGTDGQLLSALVPFLGQAMDLWRARIGERDRMELSERLLGALGGGWVRFDITGTILAVSPLAKAWGDTAGLRLEERRRIEFSEGERAQAWRAAFAKALASEAPTPVMLGEEPLAEMVLRREALAGEKAVVGALRITHSATVIPAEALAGHFGISQSEARLAALICDGFSLKEAAIALGWTEESARTCSKAIFARMGVHGQPALVRRMSQSALWYQA